MKTTRGKIPSTDYFFEAQYKKVKSLLGKNLSFKLGIVKALTFLHWFKDIN
ncbi:hypothetical protein [uncultured Winogradskyella sp.]|uniref:hypothetical protein n=1 Tax=uncultured Winogradskyella sp. TaxID=395353 RepID=UPI003515B053